MSGLPRLRNGTPEMFVVVAFMFRLIRPSAWPRVRQGSFSHFGLEKLFSMEGTFLVTSE